jgi:hypothetical protein
MINLQPFKNRFDSEFPAYSSEHYQKIRDCVAAIPTAEKVEELLASTPGKQVLDLLHPLIEVKNYKSQVPFPTNPYGALCNIAKLKDLGAPQAESETFGAQRFDIFKALIDNKGLDLPTVSAIFHFCFPGSYPIVDRNIAAACNELCPLEQPPALPTYGASADYKWKVYERFTDCLNRLMAAHNKAYETGYDFRSLDKALMVYGKDQRATARQTKSKVQRTRSNPAARGK